MNKNYYIRKSVALLYLFSYLSALVMLLLLILIPLISSGNFDNASLYISLLFIALFTLLFLKEIKKGYLDKIRVSERGIELIRFKAYKCIQWSSIKKMGLVTTSGNYTNKSIVIIFEDIDDNAYSKLTIQYVYFLWEILTKYYNMRNSNE